MKKRHHASGYLFLSARRTRLAGRLQLFEKKSFPTKILLIFNYKIVVWEKLRPSLQFSISATSALVNELAISANYQIITRSTVSKPTISKPLISAKNAATKPLLISVTSSVSWWWRSRPLGTAQKGWQVALLRETRDFQASSSLFWKKNLTE